MPPSNQTPADLHALHVTPWLSHRAGGVSAAIWGYLSHARSWRATAASLEDDSLASDTRGFSMIPRATGRLVGPTSLAFSPALQRAVRAIDSIDVIHIHGLRNWPSAMARREAQRRHLPLIVSPHGGLYPQVLSQRRWKKWLTSFADAKTLRAAALMHATSVEEARHIRAFGVAAPIAVIPLGIDATLYTPKTDDADERAITSRWPALAGKRRLLYLGFLNKKKGLLRLIESLDGLRSKLTDWHLILAGPDVGGHEAELRAALTRAGLLDMTLFTGPVWDLPTKLALLRSADLFVMPSDWENFGIVFGESLACETPIIAGKTAPWSAIQQQNCGWWIDVGVDPLTAALSQAINLSPEERKQMGQRGRQLIIDQYNWPTASEMLGQAYRWLIDKGENPAFIFNSADALPED